MICDVIDEVEVFEGMLLVAVLLPEDVAKLSELLIEELLFVIALLQPFKVITVIINANNRIPL